MLTCLLRVFPLKDPRIIQKISSLKPLILYTQSMYPERWLVTWTAYPVQYRNSPLVWLMRTEYMIESIARIGRRLIPAEGMPSSATEFTRSGCNSIYFYQSSNTGLWLIIRPPWVCTRVQLTSGHNCGGSTVIYAWLRRLAYCLSSSDPAFISIHK